MSKSDVYLRQGIKEDFILFPFNMMPPIAISNKMIRVSRIPPTIKNYSQRLKQMLAGWFPSIIRRHYFSTLDKAISSFPRMGLDVENEIVFLSYFIPPQAIALDIGANRGDYLYALEKDGKAREIHAFEPIPELASQLRKLFPGVQVHEMALSDHEGLENFTIPYINNRYFDTRGTLETYTEKNQTKSRLISVEVNTLDTFCKKNNIAQMDFLKIDVEGHEWAVLKGAKESLQQLRPLCLIEIEQRHHGDTPIQAIIAWVQQLGYKSFFYHPPTNQFLSFSMFNAQQHQDVSQLSNRQFYINNFFFIPDERMDWARTVFETVTDQRQGDNNPRSK